MVAPRALSSSTWKPRRSSDDQKRTAVEITQTNADEVRVELAEIERAPLLEGLSPETRERQLEALRGTLLDLEVRTTPDERAMIDRAVAAAGTDLTEFVVTTVTVAAQRVLADRSDFVLDKESQAAWEAVNRRRARDLPGLRALMNRPSPFADE